VLTPDSAFFANSLDHPQVTVGEALAGWLYYWSCVCTAAMTVRLLLLAGKSWWSFYT